MLILSCDVCVYVCARENEKKVKRKKRKTCKCD